MSMNGTTQCPARRAGVAGGAWVDFSGAGDGLISSDRFFYAPSVEGSILGFRLASVEGFTSVPEPSSLVLTMLASGVMLLRRKR